MMRSEGLEGRIREVLSLSSDKTFYFSANGDCSSAPSQECFLGVSLAISPIGDNVNVSFSKSVGEMGPWRDLSYFLHNDWIVVSYACDIERFRRLMKHYHKNGIDKHIIHYELKIVNPAGESLTIVDEDNISSRVILVYQDKDGEKRTELVIDEYFGERPNKGKPVPPEFDIGDTSVMSDDDVAQKLLDKILEHKDMSMGRFLEIVGESETINPQYQEGISRKHLNFFLELPRMLERGLVKAPFAVTPGCTFQYTFERPFNNFDEFLTDREDDDILIDLDKVKELEAQGMNLEQVSEVLKGKYGTYDLRIDTLHIFHDTSKDDLTYEIKSAPEESYQVSFSIQKQQLGQGRLEQFLKLVGVK